MPNFSIVTDIAAPPRVCFDLARDMGFHVTSLAHTGERIVDGVRVGLIDQGQTVTFEARHFGLRLRHTAQITRLDPPAHFRDEMVRGWFRHFVHDHHFEPRPGGTRMRDVIDFGLPGGTAGQWLAGAWLERYLHRLLATRARGLKDEAQRRCHG